MNKLAQIKDLFIKWEKDGDATDEALIEDIRDVLEEVDRCDCGNIITGESNLLIGVCEDCI